MNSFSRPARECDERYSLHPARNHGGDCTRKHFARTRMRPPGMVHHLRLLESRYAVLHCRRPSRTTYRTILSTGTAKEVQRQSFTSQTRSFDTACNSRWRAPEAIPVRMRSMMLARSEPSPERAGEIRRMARAFGGMLRPLCLRSRADLRLSSRGFAEGHVRR